MDKKKRLLLDSFSCPYLNVAIEEVLFESCQKDFLPCLRIWETPSPAICLGASQKWKEHVTTSALQERIPIVRRISGGGAVLHFNGNLNYSLFLPLSHQQPYYKLKDSYLYFFSLLQPFFESLHLPVQLKPLCDFALFNKKISGHAQKRTSNVLLHHGTFLINMPIDKISFYLKEPSSQPEYRQKRSHLNFVTSLKKEGFHLTVDQFKTALIHFFSDYSLADLTENEKKRAHYLVDSRYKTDQWKYKF